MAADRATQIQADVQLASVSLRRCKLVVTRGPQAGSELILDGDVIRVGKAAGNDLVLDDDKVSRTHFELVRNARGFLLRDLDSTNGTFLDGAEVREAYVRPGALVAAGGVELRVTPFEERFELRPSDRQRLGELVGASPQMRTMFSLIERIAPTDATVLIGGETGTGKDVIARTLHALSRRADKPMVVVDCGAVAGSLIESELFGHEKGAFTGAVTARAGAFEAASGGTVFLDEIGELALDLQPKLLRVLEAREVRRVGNTKTTPVDLRVIAATRQDLRAEVAKGKFREDLYFRLAVVPITAPPLRHRRGDVAALAEHFVQQLGGAAAAPLSPSAIAALEAYAWPGNIRELRNVVERSLALGVDAGQLVAPIDDAVRTTLGHDAFGFEPGRSFRETKEAWNELLERRYLRWLYDRAEGNVSKAARDADMDRKYLHKLLRRYGITAADGGEGDGEAES
jgi:transcriptional regulator with GAF, ATPase, and Fis domain